MSTGPPVRASRDERAAAICPLPAPSDHISRPAAVYVGGDRDRRLQGVPGQAQHGQPSRATPEPLPRLAIVGIVTGSVGSAVSLYADEHRQPATAPPETDATDHGVMFHRTLVDADAAGPRQAGAQSQLTAV
ncbi:hypothetical protein AYO39_01135 [Actinobacteria bacterium SCGC AG-212-D09]|nr:hypothetical protein AYO39_01135 [Actinobacteria bacterium SCGC AG-212-D09]